MFNKRRAQLLEDRCNQLEARCTSLLEMAHTLEDENHTLTVDNRKLKQTKRMEEEEIAHKLKMREETVDLDAKKKIASIEQAERKRSDEEISKVKTVYQDKLIDQLEKRGTEIKEMYEKILERLPDVNMAITQKSK